MPRHPRTKATSSSPASHSLCSESTPSSTPSPEVGMGGSAAWACAESAWRRLALAARRDEREPRAYATARGAARSDARDSNRTRRILPVPFVARGEAPGYRLRWKSRVRNGAPFILVRYLFPSSIFFLDSAVRSPNRWLRPPKQDEGLGLRLRIPISISVRPQQDEPLAGLIRTLLTPGAVNCRTRVTHAHSTPTWWGRLFHPFPLCRTGHSTLLTIPSAHMHWD